MAKTSLKNIQLALEFEERRKALIAEGHFAEVLKTYTQQKVFLPDENTGNFWDEQFLEHNTIFPMEEWRIKTVVNVLDCQKSILNLGVGKGALEKLLAKKCSTADYLGTDITQSMLQKLKQELPKFSFKKTDLFGLNKKKYQFDQVLLLEVLEHIKPNETFSVLEHIYGLLRPGGRFFVSVPINEGLEEMLPTNPNSHMRLYSEELLRFEVEHVGFTVEKIHRASAFATKFQLKHFLNSIFRFRQPNNLLFVCRK